MNENVLIGTVVILSIFTLMVCYLLKMSRGRQTIKKMQAELATKTIPCQACGEGRMKRSTREVGFLRTALSFILILIVIGNALSVIVTAVAAPPIALLSILPFFVWYKLYKSAKEGAQIWHCENCGITQQRSEKFKIKMRTFGREQVVRVA